MTNKEKWCRKSTGEEEGEKLCQIVSVLDVKGHVDSWDDCHVELALVCVRLQLADFYHTCSRDS